MGSRLSFHAPRCNATAYAGRSRPFVLPAFPAYATRTIANQAGESSMPAHPVLWHLDERGVATVTLNRPEVNNAYDAGLINGVLSAMDELGKLPRLRVVVLKGNGKHFQAGADLKWINAVRPQSPEENEAVSPATFEAVQPLNTLPLPTLPLLHAGLFAPAT